MAEKQFVEVPLSTKEAQYAASNPLVSSWVSANAGSGKTHVLTQRVIRLMLDGNAPDRILCLTFTKAAAANMKSRVFKTLGRWTMMEDAALDKEIETLSGKRPDLKTRKRARQLFAEALDTPGGLKIQTIHAFCEALLHQFPIEANVPGHFETAQDSEQVKMLEQAQRFVFNGSVSGSQIVERYHALADDVSERALNEALSDLVKRRSEFFEWLDDRSVSEAMAAMYELFNLAPGLTQEQLTERVLEKLDQHAGDLATIQLLAIEHGKTTDKQLAEKLKVFLNEHAGPFEKLKAIWNALFTGKNEPRKRFITKDVADRFPLADELFPACVDELLQYHRDATTLRLLVLSEHLFHIAEAVLLRYAQMKRARGLVDYDDQIEKSVALLNRSGIREWIRYRLDRGIDHVLVDEAQDTSPKQWQIINAITSDFYAGETGAKRVRTVFVVGDEKQSIYSFQGARPEEFSRQNRDLKSAVDGAQKPFHAGKLNLSFRSTPDVLGAVDAVFAHPENFAGLTQEGVPPVHDAIRQNEPGEVIVWPLFGKEKTEEPENWIEPIDRLEGNDPVLQLAERIADTIEQWVGTRLPGSEEPLKYGDILVLVRKRGPFLTALTRAMKDRRLQIAGADRFKLTEHIAVEDLLAVGQVALLPRDDLSLAAILKSPLFDIDEETLFELAYDRGSQSLFDRIGEIARSKNHVLKETATAIGERVQALSAAARERGVFEFYAWVLSSLGGRAKLLQRLGLEAEDVIDSFLEETITFERDGGTGLERFISQLRENNPEIKREVDIDRDEVRILTVHSAKGLEAKAVFLVDPCSRAWISQHAPSIIALGDFPQAEFLWVPKSDFHIQATREKLEHIKAAAEREYRRLLYVGMTRAADRLVVCGHHGSGEINHPHWHGMVRQALEPDARRKETEDGELLSLHWTMGDPVQNDLEKLQEKEIGSQDGSKLPSWVTTPVPFEAPLPRPLTPAGAYAMIEGESRAHLSMIASQNAQPGDMADALTRANCIHRLLEILPDVEPNDRTEIMASYLARAASDLPASAQERIKQSVLDVLENPQFKDNFALGSRAEVAIAGRLQTRSGERLISGQIDRLAVTDRAVTIIDYKTNHKVPESPQSVQPEYITQLSLYRELISQTYPDRKINCVLLWTQVPTMMTIPDESLDDALNAIKNS